jgi:hypothetical protein
MNRILTAAALLISLVTFAQTENSDLDNLIAISEIYSKNVNATGEDFKISVEKLRTPNLNHIIDALIASGEADEKLLTREFLSKPGEYARSILCMPEFFKYSGKMEKELKDLYRSYKK